MSDERNTNPVIGSIFDKYKGTIESLWPSPLMAEIVWVNQAMLAMLRKTHTIIELTLDEAATIRPCWHGSIDEAYPIAIIIGVR